MAYFCINFFKPYIYEPVFWPSLTEDPQIVAARSRKAAIYAWLIFLLIVIKVVLLFEYVDRYVAIPQQWWDVIIATCPIWKKSETFHNFTLVHTGLVVMMPAHFLFNYLKHKRWAETGVPPIETHHLTSKAYWIEVVAKAFGFLAMSFIVRDKGPKWIYGTSNIEPYPGFVKCFLFMFILSWLGGPYTQMIRRKLAPRDLSTKTD